MPELLSSIPLTLTLLFFIITGLFASYFDVLEGRIPNKLILASLLFLFLSAVSAGLLDSALLVSFFSALVFSFFLFVLRVWKAGDAKLFAILSSFSFLLMELGGRHFAYPFLSFASPFLLSALLLLLFVMLLGLRNLFEKEKLERIIRNSRGMVLSSIVFSFAYSFLPLSNLLILLTALVLLLLSNSFKEFFSSPSALVFSFLVFIISSLLNQLFIIIFLQVFAAFIVLEMLSYSLKDYLYVKVKNDEWRKGMIISETLVLNGKEVRKGSVLSAESIRELKRKGVKYLIVKRSIAVAPFLLLGAFLALFVQVI